MAVWNGLLFSWRPQPMNKWAELVAAPPLPLDIDFTTQQWDRWVHNHTTGIYIALTVVDTMHLCTEKIDYGRYGPNVWRLSDRGIELVRANNLDVIAAIKLDGRVGNKPHYVWDSRLQSYELSRSEPKDG